MNKVRMTLIIKATIDTSLPGNSKEQIIAELEEAKNQMLNDPSLGEIDGMSDPSVEFTIVEAEEDEGA